MLRPVILLFLAIFCSLLLLGNKNGRASQAQKGNTGAPGDETQGGQPKTCLACHNQGPIVASVALSVLDSTNTPVTQYIPGRKYIARVTITASGAGLNGYGFQMIGLKDSNNSDLDGFTDINPNNYKLATIPGGRTYAEHNNISPTNTFDVSWTAPPTGTGNVTLYASGNGVNSNGTTSGDGAGFGSIKLTEMSSGVENPGTESPKCRVYPNPMASESTLSLEFVNAGTYQISAFDAYGKKVWASLQNTQNGTETVILPTESWQAGVYFVQVEIDGKTTCVKVLKL